MKILRLFVFTIFYSAESKKHAKKRTHRQHEVRQNDQMVNIYAFSKDLMTILFDNYCVKI
jgi:hypothetical protein